MKNKPTTIILQHSSSNVFVNDLPQLAPKPLAEPVTTCHNSSTTIPNYWKEASRELAANDPLMALFVERYQEVSLASRGDAFVTLARSIVGQQISVKAAESIWQRFLTTVGIVNPECLLNTATDALRASGLSSRKVEYLHDLARHFSDGSIHANHWTSMSDQEIIRELTQIRGIGIWTVEMFLMFHEMRSDIFPLDDVGLQKAAALHYFQGERPNRKALAALGERWRPWRSVATWYLWRSLDPIAVAY